MSPTATMEEDTCQADAKDKCSVIDTCYKRVKKALSGLFTRYGSVVGRYPLPFIVLPILVFGGLGLGMMTMEEETGVEEVYFPLNSRASDDRDTVGNTFPDLSHVSYNVYSLNGLGDAVSLMFLSKNGNNVLDTGSLTEIEDIVNRVTNISVIGSAGFTIMHSHLCARSSSQCVVDGEYVLTSAFKAALAAGSVTYPYWSVSGTTVDLSSAVSSVKTSSGGVLLSAGVLKISFKLAYTSSAWQDAFQSLVSSLNPTYTHVTYEVPSSLSEELDKSTKGDIAIFAATIALCCVYASLVASGGNPVSTRGMLAFAGILAAGLGILGAMGLLSVCKVKFVNIIGIVPFLIIGIGIDDMFLLMSSWSETLGNSDLKVPARVGATLASAGIGITITSLTDFLAFMIGATSIFRSVINFSLYAGVAVLFCYIANITLFAGCLAYHGRRVYSMRHFLTCMKTRPRDELWKEGRSACAALLCGGSIPDKDGGDESLCEKLPRMCLPKIVTKKIVCVVIVLCFAAYLAVAIYGTVNLKQGLLLQNLVQDTSYYYTFLTAMHDHFPLSLPISFVVNGQVDYSGSQGQQLLDLLTEATQDSQVISGSQRCWLASYLNSTYYNSAAPGDFLTNLQTYILATPDFQADVVPDATYTSVKASRCFVLSEKTNDQYAQADLMVRLREIADKSSLPVFAYHPSFVAYEQFLAILPATLQMVGCAVAAMTVVTFVFLPHILMVGLVLLTIVMILVGIFGFMFYWDITLSSITMIHLVMSVGFSVDFSAHVCAAYLMSNSGTREARAVDAVRHAAGPILNGATSTMVGVLLLVASNSYLFLTFFKIMFLVILLGLLHAVFFLPAVLALVGPQNGASKEPRVTSSPTKVVPSPRPESSQTGVTALSSSAISPRLDETQNEYSEEKGEVNT